MTDHDIEDFLYTKESNHGHTEHGEIIYDGRNRVVVLKYGDANNIVEIYGKKSGTGVHPNKIWVRKARMPQKQWEEVTDELPSKTYTPLDSDKWGV